MPQTVVTRGCQITLTKDVRDKLGIREGDVVTVNTLGNMAIITKRDRSAWRKAKGFLPDDFSAIMAKTRQDARDRLRRLGIA